MAGWLETLLTLDASLFLFLNTYFAHPLLDFLMRAVTTKQNWYLPGGLVWIGLIWKGGEKGRKVAFLVVLVLIISDQFTSSFLKPFVGRLRPCKALEGFRLLVHCGSKYGFPSSHASNISAIGTIFLLVYHRFRTPWAALIFLMGISRIYVGVHYPGDVLAGWGIGAGVAYFTLKGYDAYAHPVQRRLATVGKTILRKVN